MTMTPHDVRRATDRFTSALATAEPAAPVPTCPGWTVRDLVAHLGNVHSWAARIVESGAAADDPDDVPDAAGMQPWYAERADRLVAALEASDPAAPCWNFARVNETKAFWSRRQVHETQMHLIDLDLAHGRPTALTPADCSDGVTECFEVFLPRMHARGFQADLTGPVSVVATDTGHTWTLTPTDGSYPSLTLSPEVLADDRLEGTAEHLWLLLWKRADTGVVRTGDGDRISRLLVSRLTP